MRQYTFKILPHSLLLVFVHDASIRRTQVSSGKFAEASPDLVTCIRGKTEHEEAVKAAPPDTLLEVKSRIADELLKRKCQQFLPRLNCREDEKFHVAVPIHVIRLNDIG